MGLFVCYFLTNLKCWFIEENASEFQKKMIIKREQQQQQKTEQRFIFNLVS